MRNNIKHFLFLFTGNTVCAGDHVSWHSALDGSESLIEHMLLDIDPQLGSINTPCGTVDFVQIIGVSYEEMRAAQRWNGMGVLDLLKRIPKYFYIILFCFKCSTFHELQVF